MDAGGSSGTDAPPTKKVRKSRWGSTDNDSTVNSSSSSSVVTLEQQHKLVEALAAQAQAPTTSISIGGFTMTLPSTVMTAQGNSASAFAPNNSNYQNPAVVTQEVTQQILILKIQLQQLNDKLMRVVQDAKEREADPRRSPSPPPKYDQNGKRSNTREVRMREALMSSRVCVIEQLIKLDPTYQPPSDFKKEKPFRKLYIPHKEFPTYNFIGLVIGPRGNTQRKLETDTGCKISIRGKGSIKEGSRGRTDKNPDADDDLHVHVSGDDESKVIEASKVIQLLLTPILDDNSNEHKQKQLRELALINGTLREDEYCPCCGEKGHKQFECPFRAKAFKAAGVKCSICGDLSHPTRDCPMKDKDANKVTEVVLDTEYDSFLAELGESPRAHSDRSSSSTVTTVNLEDIANKINSAANNSNNAASVADGTATLHQNTLLINPQRPKQTVITVTSVMTGLVPPQQLNNMLPQGIPPMMNPYDPYSPFAYAMPAQHAYTPMYAMAPPPMAPMPMAPPPPPMAPPPPPSS